MRIGRRPTTGVFRSVFTTLTAITSTAHSPWHDGGVVRLRGYITMVHRLLEVWSALERVRIRVHVGIRRWVVLTSLLMMLMMIVEVHHVAAVVAAVIAAGIVCMSGRLMHLLTESTVDTVGVVLIAAGAIRLR